MTFGYCEDIQLFLIFTIIILLVQIDNLLKFHLFHFLGSFGQSFFMLLKQILIEVVKMRSLSLKVHHFGNLLKLQQLLPMLLFCFLIFDLKSFYDGNFMNLIFFFHSIDSFSLIRHDFLVFIRYINKKLSIRKRISIISII